MKRLIALLAFALCLAGPARAGEVVVPAPKPDATCPVCGMFVAKYPEWVAAVLYKDGHVHYFDGAKDMFKYLAQRERYAPKHMNTDIGVIAVTDYYSVKPIDARQAFYVTGSDVLGPMGHELVAHKTQTDAESFLKDHKGKRILGFNDVSSDVITSLDRGRPK
jgi:nitrous oxide reductase accessory protein NosL